MIQVVRGPLEICRLVGQRVAWVAVSGASGCSAVLPRRLETPRPNAVPGAQKRPRTAISTFPLPCPPARELAGLGGVGQVDSSQIQKVGREESPSHSGARGVGGKVGLQR